MRDLDEYLAERLNEEGNFPGRTANWQALQYRLEAADARRTLLRWRAASTLLALLALFLGWQAYRSDGENKRLTAQLAEVASLLTSERLRHERAIDIVVPESSPALRRPERPALFDISAPLQEEATQPAISSLTTTMPESPEAMTITPDDVPSVQPAASSLALAPLAARPMPSLSHTHPAPQWPVSAPRRRTSRLWLGIYGTAGVPDPRPGVSLMQGAGAGVEYRTIGTLWLTASAEWLSYDVQHTDFLPASFYREKPPRAYKLVLGKPPVPYPLHDVVANQRLRFLSLGARYRLPVRGWLRPSVHVAHTWAYVSPAIYNYTFADTLAGPSSQKILVTSTTQSTSDYSVRGLWRLGVALERETDGWAVRLGMSRQECFRPDFYDTWLIQGSLWYKW